MKNNWITNILTILFLVILISENSAAREGSGLGISEASCSRVLEAKNTNKDFDDYVIFAAQGHLTGLNMMYFIQTGKRKNIALDTTDYLLAHIYNACEKNKSKAVGMVIWNYYQKLPFCDNC